ncbi:MAG: ABC transporter ATP-binding protein [Candidatus Aminicenantes bacterium]|nr:ABC transporter ATP-binding protein [Candidatus Aminicenantes bacterium]
MNLDAWKYYISLYRGQSSRLIFTIILSVGQSFLVLPIAFFVRHAFDEAIPEGNVKLLLFIGGGILLLNLANQGLVLWTRALTLKTNKKAVRKLREKLLIRCYAFPRSYYSNIDRSRLQTAIVQDTERLDWMSNALVALFLPSLVVCLGLCLVLITLNGLLFLVLVGTFPFLFLAGRSIKNRVRTKTNAFHRAFESFSKGMSFVLKTLDLSKIQTAETFEKRRQLKNFEQVEKTSRSMAWLNAAYVSLQNGIVIVSGILILVIGGLTIAKGDMTLGSLLSFYVAVSLMNRYLRTMLGSLPHIIEGKSSLDTLYKIITVPEKAPYAGRKKISLRGEIFLESVTFGYNEKIILDDIRLTIPSRSTVVLTGPNGSGKTTIAALILGFYKPRKGRLLADGIPYSDLDIRHLRRQMGVVMQDPVIFSDTIMANITYGSENVSMEEVIRISKLAGAHEFIENLPYGYETPAGEDGILLSGGQRQLIAMTRALLRKPTFLILDEPFNHFDEDSKSKLVKNLGKLENRPSLLIISHDIQNVKNAEYIISLNKGRIERSSDDRIRLQNKKKAGETGFFG